MARDKGIICYKMIKDTFMYILITFLFLFFYHLQQFKHLIVGFAARSHSEDPPGSGKYVYKFKLTQEDPQYSFILTTSAMFHVKYLEMYQSQLPDKLREFIDKTMNCEDILLNVIVANYLTSVSGKQCPAILVEKKNIRLIERENCKFYLLYLSIIIINGHLCV